MFECSVGGCDRCMQSIKTKPNINWTDDGCRANRLIFCWQLAERFLEIKIQNDSYLEKSADAADWTPEVCDNYNRYSRSNIPVMMAEVFTVGVPMVCSLSQVSCVVACCLARQALDNERELNSRFNEFCR